MGRFFSLLLALGGCALLIAVVARPPKVERLFKKLKPTVNRNSAVYRAMASGLARARRGTGHLTGTVTADRGPRSESVEVISTQAPSPYVQGQTMPKMVLAASRGAIFLSGRVFDVQTLQPAADVSLIYLDADAKRHYGAITDARGRYRARLPANEAGYELRLAADNRIMKYAEDWTPSLRTLSEESRRPVINNLLADVHTPEFILSVGPPKRRVDYFLLLPARPRQ